AVGVPRLPTDRTRPPASIAAAREPLMRKARAARDALALRPVQSLRQVRLTYRRLSPHITLPRPRTPSLQLEPRARPEPLTHRDRGVLDWITPPHRGRRGLPTSREIAAAFNLGSPSGVRSHLLALERKGWLELTGRSRALQILAVHGADGPPESRAWLVAQGQLERLAGELRQQGRTHDAEAVRLAGKPAGAGPPGPGGHARLRQRAG